jgi:hypothetical protein
VDHFEELKENIKQASVLSFEERDRKLISLYKEAIDKVLWSFPIDDLGRLVKSMNGSHSASSSVGVGSPSTATSDSSPKNSPYLLIAKKAYLDRSLRKHIQGEGKGEEPLEL